MAAFADRGRSQHTVTAVFDTNPMLEDDHTEELGFMYTRGLIARNRAEMVVLEVVVWLLDFNDVTLLLADLLCPAAAKDREGVEMR